MVKMQKSQHAENKEQNAIAPRAGDSH